jgi:hypothetical protein
VNKTELLKLIEGLGDEDNVLEALKENEDIKGFAKSLNDINNISSEDFKQLLANNKEIKGYYTSEVDSRISKAVENHDKKFMNEKFPTLLENAIKERSNEGKTPEQLKLEELQQQLDNMQKEKSRAELSSKYTKVLGEKGLSTDLIDFVLANDDDITTANIDKIGGIINACVQSGVKAKFSDNSYVPPTQENSNIITKEQFKKMNYKERVNLYKENQELYKNLNNEGEM